MSTLLYAVHKNGIPERTAWTLKAVDLMAEQSKRGHYVMFSLAYVALLSSRASCGGSFLRGQQREVLHWRP